MDSIEHIDQYWEYCHVNDIKSSTMNISCVSIYLGLIYFNDVSLLSITLMEKCINNLRYAGDTTLVSESEEELKSPLKKVKEESEKADLKFNIQKNYDHVIWSHHFMANRWGTNGNSGRLFSWAQKSL